MLSRAKLSIKRPDGELTPTLEVKRDFVYDKNADGFAVVYRDGRES